MKDKNPFLQVRGRLLLPLHVAVPKRLFLIPVCVRSQKTGFGCKQINALWQPKFIIKSRRNVSVRKAVWTVTQYRRRQRNDAAFAFEISPRAKRQPRDVHAEISQGMSVA